MTIRTLAAAAALTLAGTTVSAASLNLDRFIEGPAVAGTGEQTLVFEFGGLFASFFGPVPLPLETGAGIDFFFEGETGVFDIFEDADDDPLDPLSSIDGYAITETGFTASSAGDMLEFLLTLNLGDGSVGFGPNAVARFTSVDFDFSDLSAGDNPFGTFSAGDTFALSSYAVSPLALIPLPAGLPLLLAGLAGLSLLHRRKGSSAT